MAKHREKKRAQRHHEEVYPTMTFYPPLLTRPRSLTPAEEPVVSPPMTRVVRSRVINPGNRSLESTEAGSSHPTYPETRYQQPILNGGVKPLQQTTTAHAQNSEATADFQGPHPSGSASLHKPDTAEENDSPPSTHRAHHTFPNPDLASTHRTLKRQGISLISSLEKLVATLEALEPDPEAMEGVSSTGTVCYVPYQFPAQNIGRAVPEAEAVSRAKTVPGAHVQYQTSPPSQQGVMDPGPVRGSAGDLFAGGASIPASRPIVAGEGDSQVADLNARPSYCPHSCFCEEMWHRMS